MTRSMLLAAAFACIATPAFAQGDVDDAAPPADAPPADPPAAVKDPKAVKTWMSAADTLVKKGDGLAKAGKAAEAKTTYENAATAYGKAIEASDEPTAIQLQLAVAVEKSGDAPGAMKILKALTTQTVKPDVAKKAQTRLDDLSMKIGVVTLTVSPEGTAISIGDKQIGEAPLTEPLVLMPGNHVVSFAAVGYQPKDVELKIEAGSESERKIDLEPVPMGTKVQPEGDLVESTAPAGPKPPSLLPIYIGGGAAIGLLVVGTVTGIVAVGKHGQYSDSVSQTERADLRSSGKTFALVTDLCLVGTIGAAAFTTYWYMYKYRPEAKALAERQAMRHPKVDVLPWVQPDVGGLVAVGSF